MISAQEALTRLRQGNQRFVSGTTQIDIRARQQTLASLTDGQEPFAIILGCSDSRVPAEMIFDQDLGDLFVVRVAGNIVTPSQLGSIEFAAEKFGSKLVVVLGHSSCGAISATLDSLKHPGAGASEGIRTLVESISPSVQPLMGVVSDPTTLVQKAIRANIRNSVEQLQHGSATLQKLAESDLRIVGAEYSLQTGNVDFFGADIT